MSLDVYLEGAAAAEPERWAIFIRENGENREVSRAEWNRMHPDREPVMALVGGERSYFYSRNITHNLGRMAEAAGIYRHLWRPDEIEIETAQQLIDPLATGLARLRETPDMFKALNPENGWGSYEGLVSFVEDYLDACRMYPNAKVHACRLIFSTHRATA